MNSDQWRRVETLYHAALERELDARPSFLTETCSDEQVRLEVAALLRYDSQAKSFIETPAIRKAAKEIASDVELDSDSLPPREIGPYRLLAPLGRGGMGEVHLALDTRLNRKVAIKLLPSMFSAETELARRFKQEARASSALSHPNIVTLFEVGELKGRHYIVSEYVEGETLRQLIHSESKKGLELRPALMIAAQVARALEAAHNLGIVHRDIKPENVIVRKDGLVKVLDFGLAKLKSDERETNSQSQQLLTRTGVVMGTAAYMSPEQARGQKIDHRADIFSFGAMTYEMLSGKRPFAGATTSDVIAAVLIKDPEPLAKVAPQVRPSAAAIIHRCLEKQPEKRFQSAGELASTLDDLSAQSNKSPGFMSILSLSTVIGSTTATMQRMRQRPWLWTTAAIAGVLIIAIATLALFKLPTFSKQRPAVAFSFKLPEGWGFRRADIPAVSPDGHMIVVSAYPANDRAGRESALWIRRVDSAETSVMAGTDGALAPFWSPDSRYVAFWQENKLRKVDVSSGAISTIIDDGTTPSGAIDPKSVTKVPRIPIQNPGSPVQPTGSWGTAEFILVSQGTKLERVSATGDLPVALDFFAPGETGQFNPHFLPDGRRFFYYSRNKNRQDDGLYVASLDSGAERRLVLKNVTSGIYVSAGYLIFSRGDQLLAQHFDLKRFELTGDPVSLATRLGEESDDNSPAPFASFSASNDGVLVWRPADPKAAPQITTKLTWFDRSGKRLGSIGEPASYSGPAFSPDEKQLVVAEVDPKTRTRDLWVLDVAGGGRSRFTADAVDEFNPVWSPDGKWIYFSAERTGRRNIYRKLANGTGLAELLMETKGEENVEDISPDGRFLLFNSRVEKQAEPDLTIVSLNGSRARTMLANTKFREDQAQFSPDGRWVAYRSHESGNSAIVVRGLLPNGSPSPTKVQVSNKNGSQPRWSADGKYLFYVDGFMLMVVDIDSSGAVVAGGQPQPLFNVTLEPNERRNRYLVGRDGQRLLVVSLAEPVTSSTIAAQLNWPATLKQ